MSLADSAGPCTERDHVGNRTVYTGKEEIEAALKNIMRTVELYNPEAFRPTAYTQVTNRGNRIVYDMKVVLTARRA